MSDGINILLRFMSGYRTVCHSCYDLSQILGADITGGENTGNAGLGVFSGNDLPMLILCHSAVQKCGSRHSANADENAITMNNGSFTGFQICDSRTGNPAFR